ncbi:P-loop containing nucleoside triphosphate hydrolase protein [Mycena rosella]|uniref:P-loop containing nucleoside triphosphate hydrolase protein n=1 Tax=Mycena rosella TaxID=1033263 RepID=A0AAD7DHH4_MYCRO|nr:P-loop containing nucleoside triphosphate hydrolase protein [Mycena rosella]
MCYWLLEGYVLVTIILSLIRAIELHYSGLLLKIVQNAIENRSVERYLLFQVAASRLVCAAITRLPFYGQSLLFRPLNDRIQQHYAVKTFHAQARLDIPTYTNSAVQRQLDNSSAGSRTSIAWNNVLKIFELLSTVIELVSQFSVLISMLRDQRDGPLATIILFGDKLSTDTLIMCSVWAATTKDPDYLRSMGMSRVVHDQHHRKELVAGALADFLHSNRLSLITFLSHPLRELLQIVFTLRAVQYLSDIPLSLASLNLTMQTTTKFSQTLFALVEESGSVAENLASIRKLYETYNIPNIVADGPQLFLESQQSLGLGVLVELGKNVSFRYPGNIQDTLSKVLFKILQGQLCVIVGKNGSGKSTILKLIARLYDPTEGEIFVNDQDIRTLKLADLRRATLVLFQDYTHFLLLVMNIALGDPNNVHNEEKIREAARLGSTVEFIERLDEGFNTYLDCPVDDIYSGRRRRRIYYHGGSNEECTATSKGLSGGQMQHIALSRTFMRNKGVGLLCFDEPSASLDPIAEHVRGGYAKIWMLQAQAFLP